MWGDSVGRKRKSITQRQLEVLSARVNFALYKEVEAMAQRKDLSLTQIVRAALRVYLDLEKRRMPNATKAA